MSAPQLRGLDCFDPCTAWLIQGDRSGAAREEWEPGFPGGGMYWDDLLHCAVWVLPEINVWAGDFPCHETAPAHVGRDLMERRLHLCAPLRRIFARTAPLLVRRLEMEMRSYAGVPLPN